MVHRRAPQQACGLIYEGESTIKNKSMVGYFGITTPQVFHGMMYFGNTGTG